MSAPEPPPTEAMLDGRYRLGECVGQGGMARVYRAEDVLLGRTVAIKMFGPTIDSPSTPERARSETAVLASLNHPSLVTLFDAQLVPGRPEYMVMEFVSGPTLSALMSKGPLPSLDVAPFAADLAEALHVAHAAGVIHRDIKPSNVLLEPSPLPGGRSRAKLADFGIAWLVDTTRLTTPGMVIGTVAYLAPEQVRGLEPSPPADIYSLGLVLLEALTGAPAFPHAEGAGLALARLTSSPVIPASLGSGWPHLLTRMTATDPSLRPTAAEVAVSTAEIATGLKDSTAPKRVLAATAAAAVVTAAETAQMDSPTLVLPPASIEPTPAVAAATPRRRPRRVLAGVGAATAAVVIGVGIWVAAVSTAPEAPTTFGPAVGPAFERAAVPPAPADTVPAEDDTGVVTPADSTPSDDQTDEKSDEQEKAEKEREKAAEEERKAAEKETKKQEQEDKKSENGKKD